MPPRLAASLFPGLPADSRRAYAHQLFDELDPFAVIRNGLRRVAAKESSWAGIPMPLKDRRLVIEPHFPRAEGLADLLVEKKPPTEEEALKAEGYEGAKYRGKFWSMHKRGYIVTFTMPNGKIDWGLSVPTHPVTRLIDTLDCSNAWGLEQEGRAVDTLGTLLPHWKFKTYLLTGMFGEFSRRSKLTYIFRRLRPTLVLDTKSDPDQVRVRCALCMHPIAYYEDTWAGAMTPTDDVIAHLMLMRADEPLLWRRSNQHPAWHPNAGIF